jgi:hypothetical protein
MKRSLAYYAIEFMSLAVAVYIMAALAYVWNNMNGGAKWGAQDTLGLSMLVNLPMAPAPPGTPAVLPGSEATEAIKNILSLSAGAAMLAFILLSAVSRFAGKILRRPRDRQGRFDKVTEAFRTYVSFIKLCGISIFLYIFMPYLSMAMSHQIRWYDPVYAYTVWPAAFFTGSALYVIFILVHRAKRRKAVHQAMKATGT